MKKECLFLLLALALTPALTAFSPVLQVNLNYAHGVSSFFEINETTLANNGTIDGVKFRNRMGLGFGASLRLPLARGFSIQPAWNLEYGHQKYELFPGQKTTDAQRQNFYFRNHSLGLNLVYDLLILQNGWAANLLGGLNYNLLDSDEEIGLDKDSYLGWKAGLGFKFKPASKIGFFCDFFYKSFFSDQSIAYFAVDIGLSYNF